MLCEPIFTPQIKGLYFREQLFNALLTSMTNTIIYKTFSGIHKTAKNPTVLNYSKINRRNCPSWKSKKAVGTECQPPLLVGNLFNFY